MQNKKYKPVVCATSMGRPYMWRIPVRHAPQRKKDQLMLCIYLSTGGPAQRRGVR